ncbi:hypothetical protein, partial [Amycolatopsis thermalba]
VGAARAREARGSGGGSPALTGGCVAAVRRPCSRVWRVVERCFCLRSPSLGALPIVDESGTVG